MNEMQALRLLSDLWADLRDPDFVWQVVALFVSLGVAALVARAWRSRGGERPQALHAAGSRLAFPLTAMALAGVAQIGLRGVIHVNLLKVAVPLLGSMALVRGIVYVLRRSFPEAAWLAAWERMLAFLIWGWLALYITDLAPTVIHGLEQVSLSVGRTSLNLWMILHGLVTVFLTVVAALWIGGVVESRLMGFGDLDSSLRIVAVRVVKALLTVFALLLSLTLVGIDMTALSVFTGALGVGLGLGLQKIASNYVAGFIILLDRSIRIGNPIQTDANTGGVVTKITTRYTVLRSGGGTEFIVPNEVLVSNIVQNQTYSDTQVRLSTTVGVAYGSDLDQVREILVGVAAAHPRVLPDPAPGVALLRFGESSLDLELGFWIDDPEEGTGNIRSEINFAIWRAFRDAGIDIPFPQREVRLLQ
ncbi:MAG: mechanosensitive ion channel [Azonexus sp.]|nr:mechanosensitive ion channel [Betaproteobacteria bacterium]MBP6037112.1 mechanosensitive ion channel [Azonexus sp.]MBP6907655.1 mechanosensitive ion channel [Azonexus sp.]